MSKHLHIYPVGHPLPLDTVAQTELVEHVTFEAYETTRQLRGKSWHTVTVHGIDPKTFEVSRTRELVRLGCAAHNTPITYEALP